MGRVPEIRARPGSSPRPAAIFTSLHACVLLITWLGLACVAAAQHTAYFSYCNFPLPSLNLAGSALGSSSEAERTGSAFASPSGEVFVSTGGAVGGLMFSPELFITSFFANIEYKLTPSQYDSGSRSIHLVIHKNTTEVLEFGPQLERHDSVLFHLTVNESSNGLVLTAQYYHLYEDDSCSWLQKQVTIQPAFPDTHKITIKYDWPSMAIYYDGSKVLSIGVLREAPHFAQMAVMAHAENDASSNFQITSFRMNPWMPECGVACESVSLNPNSPAVSFSNKAIFNVTGTAAVDCNRLVLTQMAPVCPLGAYGRVFTQQRHYVGSFVASFSFSVNNCTDLCENGFGFVIHNDPRGYNGFVTAQYGGNSMGYTGATNALAVTFFDNMPDQAVTLNHAGSDQLVPITRVVQNVSMPDFLDGFKHDVMVHYDGQVMTVSLDGLVAFAEPFNIREFVAPDGFATLGFTGAVACDAAVHAIYSFDFVPGTPPVPPQSPPQPQPMSPPKAAVSSPIEAAPVSAPVATPAEIASLSSWESRPYVMAIMAGIIAFILVVGLVVYIVYRRRRHEQSSVGDLDGLAPPGSPSMVPLKPAMNTPTNSRRKNRLKKDVDDDVSSSHSRVELEDISSDDELA